MADLVSVYNQALSVVGSRVRVSATDEASSEAETCTLWYSDVRDQVLRAAPWPSARSAQRLSLLVERDDSLNWENTDPLPGWRFAYSLPSDMLYPRHLSSYGRFTLGTIPADGRAALITNEETPILIYTMRQTSVNAWDADLRMAIIYALAAHIAMPIHGKPDRAKYAQLMANQLIQDARVQAANMDNNLFESTPEWLSARGYGGSAPGSRYMYEYGPLISVAVDGVGVG